MLPLGSREQSLRIGMWIEVQMRTLSFFRLETGLGFAGVSYRLQKLHDLREVTTYKPHLFLFFPPPVEHGASTVSTVMIHTGRCVSFRTSHSNNGISKAPQNYVQSFLPVPNCLDRRRLSLRFFESSVRSVAYVLQDQVVA